MSVRSTDLAPCGVRHVEMKAPFAPIAVEPGERALYTLFWKDGRPMGFRLLLAEELPIPAAAVPAVAAHAAGWVAARDDEAALPAAASPPYPVSIVVCTRDRPEDLRRCLATLVACSPAADEIIVVDNAASGTAAEVVRAFPSVRYVHEPRPGLSHARNAGVVAARGEIIAFTDDDVEVPADWIARIAAPFADPEVACVTGLVIPADLSNAAACLFEFEVGGFGRVLVRRRFDAGYLRRGWWRSPDVWKMGAGANMAICRSAFADVGLFDPRLGAGAAGCSEDSELWFRLLRAGRVCRYDPAVVVYHHHRPDQAALTRQLRAYARGHVVALFVQFAQDRHPSHLIRAFAVMPGWYLMLMARALRRGDRELFGLVVPQVRGCLEGPFHALRWLLRPGPPRLGTGETR